MFKLHLPIHDVLDEIQDKLSNHLNLVIAAPPGAGKTSVVPLELLKSEWHKGGRVILIEPRRLAARTAAKRMADTLDEKVGQTVGYRMRLDTKISDQTRIEVVTEGVFTRMVLDDPELNGVECVIFDEFHERALEADFGLALALDVQDGLRDDLRIVVMSATLDIDQVLQFLPGANQVISKGRMFPIDIRYQPRRGNDRIEDVVVEAIHKMHAEEEGSILCFLPGQGEIKRVHERLQSKFDANTDIFMLYGALSMADQDKAVRKVKMGRRKIVLATSIAETSITIDGVRIIIDSGLQREAFFEVSTGITRLETIRASQAATTQRAGRAGRTESGIALRLWQKEQQAGLAKFSTPQILNADLSSLMLDYLAWGVKDPAALKFITKPPRIALDAGQSLLTAIGAIDEKQNITSLGNAMRQLPLPIRLSAMLLGAAENSMQLVAANLAVLLTEQGLGGASTDIGKRLKRFIAERSPRAKAAQNLAKRLARQTVELVRPHSHNALSLPEILAIAFPDRIAKRRGKVGHFTMANGRGAVLDEVNPLAQEEFLVIADLTGRASAPRILSACPIDLKDIESGQIKLISEQEEFHFDKQSESIRARMVKRLGAIKLSEKNLPKPTGQKVVSALANVVKQEGLHLITFSKAANALRDRSEYRRAHSDVNWPDMSDEGLLKSMDQWFVPFQEEVRTIKDISDTGLENGLKSLLSWEQLNELDRTVPTHFIAENGLKLRLDYRQEEVVLPVRVQQLYGQNGHPSILDGKLPLLVELLSPAGRPVQLTRDLPNFWQGSWKDVRSDMRSQYPKHDWPDDPANAKPPLRRKK